MATYTNQGYFALVLDARSAAALKQRATLPKVYCHHVTLAYAPTSEHWSKYAPLVGSRRSVRTKAIFSDGKAEAVLVEGIASEKQYPHVTMSTDQDTPPNHSNTILEDGTGGTSVEPVDLELTGIVSFVPFKR